MTVKKYKTKITYLEMSNPVDKGVLKAPENVEVKECVFTDVLFYRFLHAAVGGPWQWFERLKMPDDKVFEIITRPNVNIFVIYVQGYPAGFSEVHKNSNTNDASLEFFGIMPQYIGKKLGPYLLNVTIANVFEGGNVTRFWLHTCSEDHPKALSTYMSAGFHVYKTEEKLENVDDSMFHYDLYQNIKVSH